MPSYTTSPAVKRSKYKTRKIILIIMLVLVSIVTGGWIYWETNKKRIVKEKLVDAIVDRTGGLYAVEYDDIEMDELAGNISMMNLHVGFDEHHLDSLKRTGETPSVLMRADIPLIAVSGIKTKKALLGKQLIGRKLLIDKPSLHIVYTDQGKQASRNLPDQMVYRQILGDLKLIEVDSVEIRDARIVTYNIRNKRDSVVFANADILLGHLAIDSAHDGDKSRILFSDNVQFSCEKIFWKKPGGNYNYNIGGLKMNSDERTIRIREINVNPFTSEAAFVKSQKYQTDRMDIHFRDIVLTGVDFTRITEEKIIADRLVAGNSRIKAYRDLNIPRDSINRSGTYPHQQVDEIPIPVIIRQASFPSTYIEYTEVSDLSGKPGVVKFENCNIQVNNFTNDKAALARNNQCRVEAATNLLGLVPMKATLLLPLGDRSGKFYIEGRGQGDIDATELNKLAEPMGMARIKSGRVNYLEFKLNGDNTHAEGLVKVLYNDFKVDFLELDNDKASGIDKKDFSSFVGNIFIKDDNPKSGEEPRTVAVNHARDMNRSFYNLVWKTIFEGINKTIGNKKKMKRP